MSQSSDARDTSAQAPSAQDPSAQALSGPLPHDDSGRLGQLIERHLGSTGRGLELVGSTYPAWHWADVDVALDGLDEDQTLRGVAPDGVSSLAELLASRSEEYQLGPVQRSTFPVGPDEARCVATNALRLVRIGGTPVVVFAHSAHREPGVRVEALAADPAASRSVLAGIDAAVVSDSSLRGRVVSFRTAHTFPSSLPSSTAFSSPPNSTAFTGPRPMIDFLERPGLVADDVVLPTGRLARVEAVVLGMSRNAARLKANGQHLPRGVLLYGPPGSGKTHTVRYLLSQSPATTAFILPGACLGSMRAGDMGQVGSAGLIRQVLVTARHLTPAIVVLEDVDLVADGRDAYGHDAAADHDAAALHDAVDRGHSGLAEVLDALDELDDDEDTDIAVILTTHRVEAIEHALALRPGLIDLALEVPLPDVDLRERLFVRSARALSVTSTGVRTAAEAAVATHGSFPRQAVRRAVLEALSVGAEVDDARLLAAIRALMAEREELRTATSQKAARDQRSSVEGVLDSDDGLDRDVGVDDGGPGSGVGVDNDGLGGGVGVGDDGLGSGVGFENEGLDGGDGRDGGDGLDGGGHGAEATDDLEDGLSGEDLLDLDLDDED